MRHVREVTLIRGRIAKWKSAPPNAEVDGKTYFWSDDEIFDPVNREGERNADGGLLDRHRNLQWELKDGKVTHKIDTLTVEQKRREEERRFAKEYPQDRRQLITEDAEEARMDEAPSTDPAFQAFKAMRDRRREIKAEVDLL